MTLGTDLEFVMKTASRRSSPALYGRDDELALLRDEADASAVVGRGVLIRGPAGIGKSALLSAFLEQMRPTHSVARGVCVALESRRPFGGFVDLLQGLRRSLGASAADLIMRKNAPALARLIDAARDVTTETDERLRMDASFLALFEALARERPVIVAIEDLHWADEASLELFAYLARRARARKLMLVATVRTEADDAQPLREVIADLMAGRAVREIVLSPLGRAGTHAIVRRELGLGADPGIFADLIFERCAGNPLFVEEVIRTLIASAQLRLEGDEWRCTSRDVRASLPVSVADSVQARMSRLRPPAQHLVAVAAIVGEELDFGLLRSLLDDDEAAVADATKEAIRTGLLIERANGAIAFRHALTRDAAAHTLLAMERETIHRRVAELVERAGDPHRSETIAFHFDRAGMADRARPYYITAIFEAMAMSATRNAVPLIERTLELTPLGDASRLDLLEKLTRYLGYSGQLTRAQDVARLLLNESERRGDPREIGRALLTVAYALVLAQDRASAVPYLERARALLEPLGPTTDLAQLCQMLAWRALETRDPTTALSEGERTVTIARQVPTPTHPEERRRLLSMEGAGWGVQAAALMFLRRWSEALERQRTSYGFHSNVIDPRGRYSGLNNLLLMLAYTGGSADEARAVQRELRRYREEHGLRYDHALLALATDQILTGNWTEFWDTIAELGTGTRAAQLTAQLLAAVIEEAERGPVSASESVHNARSALAVQPGREATAAFWAGISAVFARRFSEGTDLAQHLFEPSAHVWMSAYDSGRTCLVGAVAARHAGMAEQATDFLRRAVDDAVVDALTFPALQSVQAPFAAAERAATESRFEEAIASYSSAITEIERTSFMDSVSLWLEHLARLQRAECLIASGGHNAKAAAQTDIDVVASYWRRGKANHYLLCLKTWADDHGLDLPVPSHATQPLTMPLTPREAEIASEVARGHTNREIASKFTLSVRTIDSHVEQIRSKLGFHTRAQIAAWVTERYGPQRAN